MTRLILIVALMTALVPAGCRRASQFDGLRYRHNGMHFALEVPAGWTHEELQGDLMLELRGPALTERLRPMVHVFSRREAAAVDLDRAARELLALMLEDRRFDPAQAQPAPAEAVEAEPAQVRGVPARPGPYGTRRLERTVHEGAAVIRQELIVAAKGNQVWALMASVPEVGRGSSAAALEQIKKSFEVW